MIRSMFRVLDWGMSGDGDLNDWHCVFTSVDLAQRFIEDYYRTEFDTEIEWYESEPGGLPISDCPAVAVERVKTDPTWAENAAALEEAYRQMMSR